MAPQPAAGPFQIRGLMVDPARLIERHEFYFDLLEHMARWGFNTLWWHFVDDQGVALKLRGHGELASAHPFTPAQTHRLVLAAAQRGIEVVPEVECLGHARYITRLPQYAHLADGDPLAHNAVCPSHPRTLKLLEEIIAEVAGLFDSPWFHAGLDEVEFGDCPRCRRRSRGRPPGWLYVRHARAIRDILARLGKRMIMWADHVEKQPAMLRALPKDIILAHWQYTAVHPDAIRRSLGAGFRVICVPSMLHWGDVIQPNADNFRNLDEMLTVAARPAPRGILGVVNSWWVPWRIIRDAALPAVAYTGRALQRGRPQEKLPFARWFCRDLFGLSDGPAARALWRLHELTLRRHELQALLGDSLADLHEAVNLARAEGFGRRLEDVRQCVAALRAARRKVRTRKAEFAATLLAAEILLGALETGRQVREAFDLCRGAETAWDRGAARPAVAASLADAGRILREVSDRVEGLCRATAADWDRTRYRDDPRKALRDAATSPCGADVLLGRLARSRLFLRRMSGRFGAALNAFRRGGPLPGGA